MPHNKYESVPIIDLDKAKSILDHEDSVEDMVHALLGIVESDSSAKEIQELLLQYVTHHDKWVAGAAISALADCARHKIKLDFKSIKENFLELKKKRPDLAAKIDDALADIKVFT